MRAQGKVSPRTPRLRQSRERSRLVPVSLTHRPAGLSPMRIEGLLPGCVFLAAHRFLRRFGEVGEAFLKENGNEISLKEIEYLPLLMSEQKLFFFLSS